MYTDSESLNLYDDGITIIIIFFCIAKQIKHVQYRSKVSYHSLVSRGESLVSREPWETVSTAAWTSREIFIAYCKANNATLTQQNFARPDEALSTGEWTQLFAALS